MRSFFLTVLIVSGAFLSVNYAQAQFDEQFVALDTATLSLDAATAAKGYTTTVFDPAVKVTVPGGAFSGATAIDFRKLAITDTTSYPLPYRFSQVSPIFELAVRDRDLYTERAPLVAVLHFSTTTMYPRSVFYYNTDERVWRRLPTVINEKDKTARVDLYRTFAQIAVFEQTGIMKAGRSSWYKFKGCDCTASPDYPKGTKLKVTNRDTGKSIVVTVNDWGPERDIFPDRVIDLDVKAFKKIAKKSQGTIPVLVEPLEIPNK